MASQLIEVCSQVISYHYGETSRQIFASLAGNGRSTLEALRAINLRKTPLSRVKTSLAQLIQHRLVLHHTDDRNDTYYSVDWHSAYGLLRTGRSILLVERRLGEKAAGLVAMVLQIGHCTIGDLAGVFEFDEHGMSKVDTPTHNGNGTSNGTHNSGQKDPRAIGSLAELHHILRKLLRAGFLMKLGERSFKPNADIEDELGALVMEESFPDGKITGPKKQAEFKRSVDNLKRKSRDESEYSERRDVEGSGGIVRPGMDANKRQKLNGGFANGHGGHGGDADFSGPRLPNNMSIGVNLAKCVVAMRSDILVQHAKHYLGYITAEVYRALLTALESKVRSVREDLVHYEDEDEEEEAQPVASVMEVAEFVDPHLDLAAGINGAKSDLPNGGPKAKKKGVIEYDNDFTDIGIKNEPGSDDEGSNGYSSMRSKNKRLDLVEQHLKLLEEHDKEFCRRPGAAGQSEWRVNFPVLGKILLNAEIDTTIDRRFGPAAVRVARMLRQEGRLEEKGVAQKCLKHVKEIRGILAQMQAAGFLESQEVPKDQYRQPTRSLYLWFFDEKKVAQLVLHQAYQGIARCMQRMDVEQEKFQQILDKRERLRAMNPADAAKNFIIGKTGMLEEDGTPLSGVEKQQISLWRETQEKLLTQVKRLDDVVGVVRDFTGKDVTMKT